VGRYARLCACAHDSWGGVAGGGQDNAMYTCARISKIPGLQAIVPAGTMYVMVRG
jgi:hypothetical protein